VAIKRPFEGLEMSESDLPPGFSFLVWGKDQYTLVNDNADGHRSAWTDRNAMTRAAWDWWHDVRSVAATGG